MGCKCHATSRQGNGVFLAWLNLFIIRLSNSIGWEYPSSWFSMTIPIKAHHVLPGVPFCTPVSIPIPITKRCSTIRSWAPPFPPPISASTPTAISYTPAKWQRAILFKVRIHLYINVILHFCSLYLQHTLPKDLDTSPPTLSSTLRTFDSETSSDDIKRVWPCAHICTVLLIVSFPDPGSGNETMFLFLLTLYDELHCISFVKFCELFLIMCIKTIISHGTQYDT